MSRLHNLKSTSVPKILLAICVTAFVVGGSAICTADDTNAANDARATRRAELDAKVGAVLDQFKVFRSRLDEASDQAKTNLGVELDAAARELAKAFDEREAELEMSLSRWSKTLDATWKEFEEQGQITRVEAASALEEMRQAWNSSYKQLRSSHQEQVEHYRNELTLIEDQVAAAADDLNEEWIGRRRDARKRYEETATSMRASYQESIASLEKEIARLRAGANKASEQNREKFVALADSLSEQTNLLHQELLASYRDTADKADRYLVQTKAKLVNASDDVKSQVQIEADQVSAAVCELNSEMAAHSEQYRDSLDQQLMSVKQRAANAEGNARQSLAEKESELREQSEEASQQLAQAYASYLAALKADIDHMKARLSDADAITKEAMIKAIEQHQEDLKTAKQKL